MKIKHEAGWKELPIAGLIPEGGTAEEYKTGAWRSRRPVWDKEKCKHCLFCWVYCPDSSILIKDKKMIRIDYDYCKGCGICAQICPPKIGAISMIDESGASQS